MNYIKKYLDYITEKKASKDEVYVKYYSDINDDIYNQIISADPSARGNSIGLYSQWLLSLYRDKKLKLEDLYKATEYLRTFHQFKMKLGMKDLSGVSSLPELFKIVEPYIVKEDAVFSNEAERALVGQFKQIFKNKKYRIIIPLTLKASKYFGKGTEWCTLNTDQFKSYTKNQNPEKIDEHCLYILYTEDPEERLQFSFDSRQFMNVEDYGIDMKEFFEDNKDIKEFFDSHFDTRIFVESPDVAITEMCEKYGLRILITQLYVDGYEDFNEYKEANPDWANENDIVSDEFGYDDNPMDGSMTFDANFIFNTEENLKKFEDMLRDMFKNISLDITDDGECYHLYANL
jgi:hypothetical protein